MKRRICSYWRGILSASIFGMLVFGMLANAAAGDYYQGQTITIICSTSAGGGSDMWVRMISRNLRRFIPGNPNIVVRNIPSANGLIAGNLAWHAKPDGKTLFNGTNKVNMSNILRPKGAEFYLEKMHPVYATPFGVIFYFKSGLVSQVKDIQSAKGLVWAHDAPIGGPSILWVFAKAVLGYESKDIMGYGGSGPAKLAFMTGEANCTGAGSDSLVTIWRGDLERGEAVALFQSGILDADGNVVKEASIPPFPTTRDIYQQLYGKEPSGPAWDAYKLPLGTRAYDNSILLPPATKPEYVKIIRKAFEDMAKDSAFLKEADGLSKGVTHIVGERLTRGYAAGVSGKPETVQFMKNHLTEKYGVVFQ